MENKLARICFNTNKWILPSGNFGKSKDRNSFEYDRGYGHEEWLNDHSKLINGYKYSFLQPINTPNKKHQGLDYAIWLYTMDGNRKLCLGKIKKVECVTRKQAEVAISNYHESGWFDDMYQQLKSLDIDTSSFIEDDALNLFNIRFKPHDLIWFDEPIDITEHYGNNRYVLLNLADPDFVEKQVLDDNLSIDINQIVDDTSLSHSERESLIMARVGQGKFRQHVINTWGGEKCAITLTDVRDILIASHIKAWKDCKTTKERLDGANGIMLCAHIDKLFDNHLITFKFNNNKYKLEVSPSLDMRQMNGLGLESGHELNITHLDFDSLERFKSYMDYHNQEFDMKNAR
ncbi:hypothetical protein C942_00318 [Photobacterium marinum]|uniref:HNH nuclease domain-containing protein n=1 Tax=Photobacterium marinum TaxID=1056511 RepID=L8JFD3_9GAMM|nr:HNH endonuclease [Photobacterium marinum]ELR66132.1 hypothetical protein C942_00318 [Photobacterium marinum]